MSNTSHTSNKSKSNLFRDHILSLPQLVEELIPVFTAEAARVIDEPFVRRTNRLFTIGCGDSHHAALGTELAFEQLAGVPTEPMTAMQFSRYAMTPAVIPGRAKPASEAAVIGVSVSGGVTRTVEGVMRARARGMTTLAITSSETTPVAKAAERVLTTRVPDLPNAQGVMVPGSRSFFASLVMLYSAALRWADVGGGVAPEELGDWRSQFEALPSALRATIALSDPLARQLAEDTQAAREFVYCGSGPNHASALFGAAKLLEATGDPAMGQDVEEWAHLQYFAKAADTPSFLITARERDDSRAGEVATAMTAVGRRVILVAPRTEGVQTDAVLPYAPASELFAPLLATVPLMLFAAHRSAVLNEPYFRAFGGGRSVENGGGISRIRTSELQA